MKVSELGEVRGEKTLVGDMKTVVGVETRTSLLDDDDVEIEDIRAFFPDSFALPARSVRGAFSPLSFSL